MVDISHAAISLISIIASLGIALSASEELATRRTYADGGLLSWSVLGVTRRRSHASWIPLDRLFDSRVYTATIAAKLAAAVTLVAVVLALPDARLLAAVLTSAILALLLLMNARTSYGLDGADHMYLVLFLGLAVYQVMPAGSIASLVGILYIAAQSGISYLIAGIAKIFGASWRDGTAISGIMTTKIYGHTIAAARLQGRPALGRLLCWLVIAFEIMFVASLIAGPRAMWAMLAVGVLFHASTALLMGLNSFFFAFVATYPAIVVLNELVHRFVT